MRPNICIWACILAAAPIWAQTAEMTSEDVVKLAKSGLSDAFIVEVIDKQGARLNSDVSSLVQLKEAGVNERILAAVVRRGVSTEALNTDSVVRLVKANFSDGFILDLLARRPGQFAVTPARILELKQAGVSERLLSALVSQSATRELPRGTEISVRLIDAIDSEVHRVGNEFQASLEAPLVLGSDVIAPKGARAVIRLVDTEESGKLTGRTSLSLQLVSVQIDGRQVELNTSDLAQTSASRGERTAKSAAAVGVLGAIIGGIAGGGKGAAIGAAAGAGAGAGAQVLLDPQRVKVPSETVLHFVLERPARI
jgi:hypothetical protein